MGETRAAINRAKKNENKNGSSNLNVSRDTFVLFSLSASNDLLFLLRPKKKKRGGEGKEETCVTQKETIEIFPAPDNPARDVVRSGNKWRSVVRVAPTVFYHAAGTHFKIPR